MEHTDLLLRFGTALAIGFLVGMQRKYAGAEERHEIYAGERTLALMGLFGCAAAMAADVLSSPWVFAIILLPLWALIIIAYARSARVGDIGLTSETAALVTTLAGALCYWSYLPLAVAIGVTTTVLLSLKMELQGFVKHLTREDIYATLKFAVITVIILPVLPDQAYGPAPLDVLNPYNVWLMVIFISGISFCGYVLVKVVGSERGIGLTGLLGGLVSSTAVTLTFTQRSRTDEALARPFALAITVAWTMMFFRVAVEVAALNMPLLGVLWMPLVASTGVGLAYCAYLYYTSQQAEGKVEVTNPFELGPAIKFGLLYGVIIVVARAAQMHLGDTGLYLSSVVSGVADVDAITLSVAELSRDGAMEPSTGARAIILAAVSNTVVKGGIVFTGAAGPLKRAIAPGFVLMLVAAVGVAWLI
ncbi:MgtC/SapB family protein [Candidatus Latescibacterota bacterium]